MRTRRVATPLYVVRSYLVLPLFITSFTDQEWKHSCYEQCLVPVLDAISKPGLEYKSILDLDRRIRDFSIPAPLRNKENLTSRSLVMQRASLGTALEAGVFSSSFFDSDSTNFFTTTLISPIWTSSAVAAPPLVFHPCAKRTRRGIQQAPQVRTIRRSGLLERFEDDCDCSGIVPT